MRKVPTTSVPMTFVDILAGFRSLLSSKPCIKEFERKFAEYIGVRHCITANKGTTALYIAIKAMAKFSNKHEVILPAYTVPTLTLAMNRAGLKTRLCDISVDTFNMDAGSLSKHTSSDTLCVVPVHMFGFPCELDDIRAICDVQRAFMLEDPAQAMGAELNGRRVGAFGDVSIFSLCKGKVISTFQGGMAVTNNSELAYQMMLERERLPQAGNSFAIPLVLLAFTYAMRPLIYGTFYPLIERFKSTEVHENFTPEHYSSFKAAVAMSLLEKMDRIVAKRYEIGMALYNRFKGIDWLILPRIIEGSKPVFNHLPVVFKDMTRLEAVKKSLWQNGIDTARMYMRPIHHIYNLGYNLNPDPFPNATYIAERLMILPSHPYMRESDIEKIIDVFKKA